MTQNVVDLPLHQLCIGTRKRPVDQASVMDIARSIEQDGLLQAIGVTACRCTAQAGAHYRVVFGVHRHAALTHLQRTTIAAHILPEGLRDEAYQLIELRENSARNDLTGAQRKAYAAEVGRLLAAIAEDSKSDENSNSQNLNDEWFLEIGKNIGVTQATLYNWWKAFCRDTGLDLPPRRALVIHQEQFFTWLDAQQAKAEAEKQRREKEVQALRQQEELEEASEFLQELIQKYGKDTVWQEVLVGLFGDYISSVKEHDNND